MARWARAQRSGSLRPHALKAPYTSSVRPLIPHTQVEDDAWPEEEEEADPAVDTELPRLVLHPCTPVSDAGKKKKTYLFLSPFRCHASLCRSIKALLRLYYGFIKALLRRY